MSLPASYCSPLLEARPLWEQGHFGLFAREVINPDDLLVMWSGRLVTLDQADNLPPLQLRRSVQVEDNLLLLPVVQGEPADFVNHSCNPNTGLRGQTALVALRTITVGEEICYDYAMTDGSSYDEFECQCGAANCRGRITGNDWQLPNLQVRYAGHFSPYLQRRIDQMHRRANAAD